MTTILKRPFLAGIGLFIYGSSTYAAYHAYRIYQLPEPAKDCYLPQNQFNREEAYNNINLDYDKEIDWDEYILGIDNMRRDMIGLAKGKVLEVAAGTGRNLQYYNPDQVESVVMTEKSRLMLEKAVIKFRSLRDLYKSVPVQFKLIDGHSFNDFESNSIDTVVQTFGLCSLSDPVQSLNEASRVCKPEGRILLIEHGRSYYGWLNKILDKTSTGHAQKWGCWWNRDIIQIVKEANLEIERMDRNHFGTTCRLICRPK